MSKWAWVWLGLLGLFGWIPSLGLSYLAALLLSVATGINGIFAFVCLYVLLMVTSLFYLVQVRNGLVLEQRQAAWFVYGGGSLVSSVWVLGLAATLGYFFT